MHEHAEAILAAFRRDPQAVYTTTDLVRETFPRAWDVISKEVQSSDASTRKRGLRNKGKLHRTLLYHLNRLVSDGVLDVAEIRERGEKAYRLALEAGQLTVRDSKKTIAISKHPRPESFVGREVETGQVVLRSDGLHKVDAYALDARALPGIHHLRKRLTHIYTHIADSLGLVGFESLLDQDPDALSEGLAEIIADSRDYGVTVTLTIDLTERALQQRDMAFFTHYALQHPRRVYTHFLGTRAVFKKQSALLERIAELYAQNNIKLTLQDLDRSPLPWLMGSAGMYAITQEQARRLDGGVVVAASSVAIDLGRGTLSAEQFRDLARRSAKTLLARQALQRRLSTSALAGLLRSGDIRSQISHATNYIRVWNQDALQHPYELLASTREELERFARQESAIFESCGVPMNFSVKLSSAFPHFGALSPRQYQKLPVLSRRHLPEQNLEHRERLLTIYSCDRVRIFREGSFTGADLLEELRSVLHGHNIPLITYDFRTLKKTVSLTQFMP